MSKKRVTLLILTMFFCCSLWANQSLYQFKDEQSYQRFEQLTKTLRCMVCQNESLDGSQAQLAVDLKNRIAEMLNANYTDDQIKAAMVTRYGDYIVYQPPLNRLTFVLWSLPVILLLIVAGLVYKLYRRKEPS